MRLLCVADLHGKFLQYEKDFLDAVKAGFDVCLLLGDNNMNDLKHIIEVVPQDQVIGVLGNHDSPNYYDQLDITNIDKKVVQLKGFSFAGMEGSLRYNSYMPGYTHEESVIAAEKMEKADVMVCHTVPYTGGDDEDIHNGLKGITAYIEKNSTPYLIHGHLHENKEYKLPCGTACIGVRGIKVVVV